MVNSLVRAVNGIEKALRERPANDHSHQILQRIEQLENNLMSKITDWASAQEADLAEIQTTLEGIAAGIVALDKQIADLQNSPGTITPEDQAALDRIQAASKALVARAKDIRVDAETNPPVA